MVHESEANAYELTIERPAAGGRMIARHDGAIVFVSGAIPGEVVEAEIEKVQRGTVWASAKQILEPSPDRVDRRAGRRVRRFGASRTSPTSGSGRSSARSSTMRSGASAESRWTPPVEVVASPIDGYRMRARAARARRPHRVLPRGHAFTVRCRRRRGSCATTRSTCCAGSRRRSPAPRVQPVGGIEIVREHRCVRTRDSSRARCPTPIRRPAGRTRAGRRRDRRDLRAR